MYGCREIKRSLQTCDYRAAKTTASVLAYRLKDTFKMTRSNTTLTPAEIQFLVDKHVNETLEALEGMTVTSPRTTVERARRDAEALEMNRSDLAEALVGRRWGVVDNVVNGLLEGREVDQESRNRLAREVLRVVLPLTDVHIAHIKGDYDVQYQAPKPIATVVPEPTATPSVAPVVIQAAPMTTPPPPPSITLSELITRYFDEKQEGWAVGTLKEYRSCAKMLKQMMGGGLPVNTLGRAVFRDYRNALLRLPPRISDRPNFSSLTSQKVLEMDKPEDTISPKMVNKQISFASGLFRWAKTMGYMDDNPAEGMRVPVTHVEPAMFEDADLLKIFGTPAYAPKYPSQFWVPLLGLYTGARQNEICQLYVTDITREEDSGGVFWWISINDEGDDKSVKTKNGKRTVPIHPALIRLGFIEYVKGLDPRGRVFPDLPFSEFRQNYADRISKWFNRHLKNQDVKPSKAQRKAAQVGNKTFHTLRHTAITTMMRAKIDYPLVAAVVGHDSDLGITGHYHHGYLPRQLYNDVVSRFDYQVEVVDLLKGHKYAGGPASKK